MTEPTRHIFVCRGPHCTRRDSRLLRDRLREIVESRAGQDPAIAAGRRVVVSSYPCFGLCEQGPNALVYPQVMWYSGLDKWDLDPVADHLYGGPPHEAKCVVPDEIVTDCALENIREAWGLVAERPKIRIWPFGRR